MSDLVCGTVCGVAGGHAPRCPASTPRLGLRCFTAADLPEVTALHRDPRVRTLLVDDHALEQPALARRFLQGLQAVYHRHPGLGIWRAERRRPADAAALAAAEAEVAAGELAPEALAWLRRGDAAFAGWFSLMPMSAQPGRVEIGCRLLPAAWGTGLVLEGGTALIDHAFGALALPELWAACHPEHRPVQAVLRTLGFEPAGHAAYEGRADAAHYRLGAPRWQALRTQPLRQRQRAAVRALAGRHSWPGADPQLPAARLPGELGGDVQHLTHPRRARAAQPQRPGPTP